MIILDSVTATHSMVAGAARGTLSKIIKSGDLKQKKINLNVNNFLMQHLEGRTK